MSSPLVAAGRTRLHPISARGVNSSSRSAAPLRLSTRRRAASPSVIQPAARFAQSRTLREHRSKDPTSLASAVYFGGFGGAPDFQRIPGAGPIRGSQVEVAGTEVRPWLDCPDSRGWLGGVGRGRVRGPRELPGGLRMGLGGNGGVLACDPWGSRGAGTGGPSGPATSGLLGLRGHLTVRRRGHRLGLHFLPVPHDRLRRHRRPHWARRRLLRPASGFADGARREARHRHSP